MSEPNNSYQEQIQVHISGLRLTLAELADKGHPSVLTAITDCIKRLESVSYSSPLDSDIHLRKTELYVLNLNIRDAERKLKELREQIDEAERNK